MEIIRFSSSKSVRVTTASVFASPSVSRIFLSEPSAFMIVAFGRFSESSWQRAGSFSMSYTSTPDFMSSAAR